MNYLQNILNQWGREGASGQKSPRPPRSQIWNGTAPSHMADAQQEAARFNAAADWQFANEQADKNFAQDYKMRELALLEGLSQMPQRGGRPANIGGRFGAGQGSFVGPDMQMLDRQRNRGQFQPLERPRIVNNLTQLMRPYQG